MNYGYDSTTPGWKASRKHWLARELDVMLRGFISDPQPPAKSRQEEEPIHRSAPYVEVDRLYPGVRIRRITHFTDAQQDELVRRADKVYSVIMEHDL